VEPYFLDGYWTGIGACLFVIGLLNLLFLYFSNFFTFVLLTEISIGVIIVLHKYFKIGNEYGF
jgi:hypothetical protein